MDNNETYFKILLDKIEELVRENENLKIELEHLEKNKESKKAKINLKELFDENNFN